MNMNASVSPAFAFGRSLRRLALPLALVLPLGVTAACSGEVRPRGQLTVAVTSDLKRGAELDTVVVDVFRDAEPFATRTYDLAQSTPFPITLAIAAEAEDAPRIRVRVQGFRGGGRVAVREAVTTIPRTRNALLRMPLEWLCSSAAPDTVYTPPDCATEGETCAGGECASATVDEASLHPFDAREVFDACFDASSCFAGAHVGAINPTTCVASLPEAVVGAQIALETTEADASGSWTRGRLVPLRWGGPGAFQPLPGGGVQLPNAVCARGQANTFRLLASDRCTGSSPDDRVVCAPKARPSFDELSLSLSGMTSYVNERFEYRVVDAANVVRHRGILAPVGDVRMTINAPRAIPQGGGYRLELYADRNGSGAYESGETDRGWRIDPLVDSPDDDSSDGIISVHFANNFSFHDLNEYPRGSRNPPRELGAAAVLRFSGMRDFAGRLLEARVERQRDGTEHVVGLYRVASVAGSELTLTVPGVVVAGGRYVVTIYVDANGNGRYDDPARGGDFGWRIPVTAGESGLELDFDPATFPNHTASVDGL